MSAFCALFLGTVLAIALEWMSARERRILNLPTVSRRLRWLRSIVIICATAVLFGSFHWASVDQFCLETAEVRPSGTGQSLRLAYHFVLLALLIVFVIIQFIRPKQNTSDVNPQDITHVYMVPENVHQILTKACLDCHSNNTRYPWYNNMAPVSWFLNDHILEAKKELNFSEFGNYPPKRQAKKLAKVAKSIDEGWMPLDSYLWIHKDAKLTDEEKQKLYAYFNTIRDTIKARYPADSLIVPKRPEHHN